MKVRVRVMRIRLFYFWPALFRVIYTGYKEDITIKEL
jgi:hypothetical protein